MDDWEFVDALLGLDLINSTPNITDNLMEKISLREKARQEKDYMTADKMRDELASANITILDTEKSAIWQYTK